jgi:hypothetical protein
MGRTPTFISFSNNLCTILHATLQRIPALFTLVPASLSDRDIRAFDQMGPIRSFLI